MISVLIGAFLAKSVVAIYVWSDKLAQVSYRAALHLRELEGRAFTAAEDALEKQGLKVSAIFTMAVPVLGCLAVTLWPNAALPKKGRFKGASDYRAEVREICWKAFVPDVVIAVTAFAYWAIASAS